jgi:hypothetical protein
MKVHVTGIGDFQLKQIDVLQDPNSLQRAHKVPKGDQMLIETSSEGVSASFILQILLDQCGPLKCNMYAGFSSTRSSVTGSSDSGKCA